MPDYSIRPATPDDQNAIETVIRAAYAPYAKAIPDLPDVASGIGADIRDNSVLVADRNGAVLGALVLVAGGDAAKLANLAVHPDHGGLGIGRALIAEAENEARAAGAASLDLATHSAMPGNITLYDRLGWSETGRDGTRVFMTKSLR